MDYARSYVGAAAIAVTAAIILPVIFGDGPTDNARAGEDAWRTVIFEFQTLFAGVLATGAALITVFYLRRQVDVAQMQARDTFAVSLRRTRTAAKKCKLAARDLVDYVSLVPFDVEMLAHDAGFKLFKSNLRDFGEALHDEIFGIIESEIEYPKRSGVLFLQKFHEDLVTRRQTVLGFDQLLHDDISRELLSNWKALGRATQTYASEIIQICDEFLAESESVVAKYR